jgi:hemoglobin
VTHDDAPIDDFHPMTQHLLSRRGFLGTGGKAVASLTFLGLALEVTGCAKEETATGTGGGTTAKPGGAAGSTTSTTAKPTGTAAPDSLYAKLGGNAAITAVVGAFLGNVVADTRINAFFKGVDAADLQKKLVDQIGQATGGPEVYKGRSMKEAHAGLKITVADFNALVDDLVKALDGANVPKDLQTPLLDTLAGMQPDIVTA